MEFVSRRQPRTAWIAWLDSWVADVRVQGLTINTIEAWWYEVSHFAIFSRKDHDGILGIDVVAYLGRGVSNAGMRVGRNALASFSRWAVRTKRLSHDFMTDVPRIKRDKHKQLPAPPIARDLGLSSTDWRVRLMVMLAADAGLRRREICQVRTNDVIEDAMGPSLVVHGKGEKDRIVPLTDLLATEIRSRPKGWLFPGEHGHLCPDTVYRLVKQVTGWSPHLFRRRFATDLWHATCDVAEVQALLGHESLATTQQYIFSCTEDNRKAMKSLDRYRYHAYEG